MFGFYRSHLDCIQMISPPALNILSKVSPLDHTRKAPHRPSFPNPSTHTGSKSSQFTFVFLPFLFTLKLQSVEMLSKCILKFIWWHYLTLFCTNTHTNVFNFCSILIFMALKNSKTGSLPVSEIYSFMTEHFPYFKVEHTEFKNTKQS